MGSYIFSQRSVYKLFIIKFITLIVFLSQASFADQCEEELSFSTEEFRDIIEVAKIISFLSANHSSLSDEPIDIRPIDMLIASMTRVVEVNSHSQISVVKADLTTGMIFNGLKSLKEGTLLFDLQNRIWEELGEDDPIKEFLSLESPESGYILTLDKSYTGSFEDITSRNTILNQSSDLLLQRSRIASHGDSPVSSKDLFVSMIAIQDLYFIYELFSLHLVEKPRLFERWFGDRHRRQINETRSIYSIINNGMDITYRYVSILQLQIIYHVSQKRQNSENRTEQSRRGAGPIDMNTYLLRKFGFSRSAIERSIDQLNDGKLINVRGRIKRRVLRNTSSLAEMNEVREIDNEEIDILVDENDVRGFLKYHRSFTDEESELFIRRFIKEEEKESPAPLVVNLDKDETRTTTTQVSQQLIDRLDRMGQDDLEVFVEDLGFEVSSRFMARLMNPQRVPQNVRHSFIRFIAYVKQVGNIFNIRTSNNAYGLKRIPGFHRRNKKQQGSSYDYYSLHLNGSGTWILLLREEKDIFTLDRIVSHATYERYF